MSKWGTRERYEEELREVQRVKHRFGGEVWTDDIHHKNIAKTRSGYQEPKVFDVDWGISDKINTFSDMPIGSFLSKLIVASILIYFGWSIIRWILYSDFINVFIYILKAWTNVLADNIDIILYGTGFLAIFMLIWIILAAQK